jgi:alginate O-acetyltransferase complex protein AlgI
LLFASPTFLFVFLPVSLAAYFAAPGMRAKNAVLIAGSLIFYAWGEPLYAPLIAGMTLFNYAAALATLACWGSSNIPGFSLRT